MEKLSEITYGNSFVKNFKGDESGSTKPRQTPGVFWSKAVPTPVPAIKLLAWSDELAQRLQIAKPVDEKDLAILGGNGLAPSMYPYAASYAGHQFGHWAGQLGDGRAITLGERITGNGEKWELQLKGAGPTAYSRRADGRAVLRSSVREYLMSEAMHYLGVPTTRALSLVSTGDPVLRDMFYDGHAAYEPGAIVMRVAPSFLRFGNYEMLAARNEVENLRQLVDWTIGQYFPHLTGDDKILQWYKEVVDRTARLMAEWLRVGFVHGVMNTDNMSILGLTIDYGPYSFVDNYDPMFTPNTTDLPGRRYAFGRQAAVAKWNLGCLGGALAPLFNGTDELTAVIETYDEAFWIHYHRIMGEKLGLDELTKDDATLAASLEECLGNLQPDMTLFFRLLTSLPQGSGNKEALLTHFDECFYTPLTDEQSAALVHWLHVYQERIGRNNVPAHLSKLKMEKANPVFVLRNYLLHQAIGALEKGDDSLFRKLESAIRQPYQNAHPEFWAKRPGWASEKAGCSMLSCSS